MYSTNNTCIRLNLCGTLLVLNALLYEIYILVVYYYCIHKEILKMSIKKGDFVFAKVKGYPSRPAVVD